MSIERSKRNALVQAVELLLDGLGPALGVGKVGPHRFLARLPDLQHRLLQQPDGLVAKQFSAEWNRCAFAGVVPFDQVVHGLDSS